MNTFAEISFRETLLTNKNTLYHIKGFHIDIVGTAIVKEYNFFFKQNKQIVQEK